jgi:ATP-dependent Clp protease adaptor protein ClpS
MNHFPDAEVAVADKVVIQRPRKYHVVLLNDDFTPMDFVVKVLEEIFYKTPQEAAEIMMIIHTDGAGVCGTYSKEVADEKAAETMAVARAANHPLRANIVPEDS